jgi:carbon monoxide dehydrogenase subunit G
MASMSTKGKIDASPDQVWTIVSDFGGLDKFFPPVAKSEGSGSGKGMERTCTFHDGAQITETLLELDDNRRSLTYKVHDPNPFPFKDYVATMHVTDAGGGASELEWSAEFESEGMTDQEVADLLDGLFRQGIDGVGKLAAGV